MLLLLPGTYYNTDFQMDGAGGNTVVFRVFLERYPDVPDRFHLEADGKFYPLDRAAELFWPRIALRAADGSGEYVFTGKAGESYRNWSGALSSGNTVPPSPGRLYCDDLGLVLKTRKAVRFGDDGAADASFSYLIEAGRADEEPEFYYDTTAGVMATAASGRIYSSTDGTFFYDATDPEHQEAFTRIASYSGGGNAYAYSLVRRSGDLYYSFHLGLPPSALRLELPEYGSINRIGFYYFRYSGGIQLNPEFAADGSPAGYTADNSTLGNSSASVLLRPFRHAYEHAGRFRLAQSSFADDGRTFYDAPLPDPAANLVFSLVRAEGDAANYPATLTFAPVPVWPGNAQQLPNARRFPAGEAVYLAAGGRIMP